MSENIENRCVLPEFNVTWFALACALPICVTRYGFAVQLGEERRLHVVVRYDREMF